MSEVYCKCGCGRRISHYKAKKGQIFYNRICSNNYNLKNRVYKKNVNKDFYKWGKKYCKNYNDEKLKCVICYENKEKQLNGCGV